MLRYPAKARRALAFLFRRFNDIDIYVEDTVSRNMYEVLLQRILEGRAKVNRIFQVGNKTQVIDACTADQNDPRPRLYLIDGDLDLILGNPAPALNRLYSLQVYSAENLLWSEAATNEIAFECLTNESRSAVGQAINFQAFQASVLALLRPLFATYAATYKLDSTLQTVSYHVMRLTVQVDNAPVLDDQKVLQRIAALETELSKKVPAATVIAETTSALQVLNGPDQQSARYISGKTYLLPLVYHHLRRHAGYAGSFEQLKVRLARFTELTIDPGLAAAVLDAAA